MYLWNLKRCKTLQKRSIKPNLQWQVTWYWQVTLLWQVLTLHWHVMTLLWHVTLLCQVIYFSHPQCCNLISHICNNIMMGELMKQSDMNLLKLTCNLQTVQPTRIFQYQHCLLRQIYTCYNMADLWLCHNNIVYIYTCVKFVLSNVCIHIIYIYVRCIFALSVGTQCVFVQVR